MSWVQTVCSYDYLCNLLWFVNEEAEEISTAVSTENRGHIIRMIQCLHHSLCKHKSRKGVISRQWQYERRRVCFAFCVPKRAFSPFLLFRPEPAVTAAACFSFLPYDVTWHNVWSPLITLPLVFRFNMNVHLAADSSNGCLFTRRTPSTSKTLFATHSPGARLREFFCFDWKLVIPASSS